MSQENKNAPVEGASLAQRRAAVDTQDFTTESPLLSSNWPDVDALADLITAEVEEHQATTPEAWIEARLKWFDAHGRYFYGRRAADV